MRIDAVDFVGLEIAKGDAKERRTNATTGRPLHQIADSVLVLSGSGNVVKAKRFQI